MAISAMILAGGEAGEELAPFCPEGKDNKGLIEFNGKPMVELTLDAVLGARGVDRAVLVGPEPLLRPVAGDRVEAILPDSGKLFDNLLLGLDFYKDSKRLLVATADIPLITSAMIDDFLDECERAPEDIDIFYPVVSKETIERKAPIETKRTYGFLRDMGALTGGNIFLLNPGSILPNRDTIIQAIANRKKPWRLAAQLGAPFILRFLLKRLYHDMVVAKVQAVLGCKVRMIMVEHPEIAMDLDKPSDCEAFKAYLEKQR